jgi:thioredoxin reductase
MSEPTDVDLVIVGAGPAGLAAAVAARRFGLATIVLDEQSEPGGQIYRGVETIARTRRARLGTLGPDYAAGLPLVERFRDSGVDYRPLTAVWRIDPDRSVYFNGHDGAGVVRGHAVLVATGALERPVPIPGWTLPGVLTCGGAQILFKTADAVPAGRAFLAGSGPLLYLYAWQLLRADTRVSGILESTPRSNYLRALAGLPDALRASEYLAKGWRMMREIARAGIPIYRHVSAVRALGDGVLTDVEFHHAGRTRREAADVLLLHEGVVPNVNLPFSIGCARVWDGEQRAFRPRLSEAGETSVPGIFVAGDGARIGGAKAAEHAGTVAAAAVAARLGRAPSDPARAGAEARAALVRHMRVRPFLDTLYAPPHAIIAPQDPATIVCRCEEVTAGEVRALARQGCVGLNQMKAFVRCGMGPCQGRFCGLTIVELIAEERGVRVEDVDYFRLRSPVKPITVGELAALAPAP